MRRTAPPSAEIEQQIDRLLAVGVGKNPRELLSELARLGARLIIQRAVQDEFDAWLGRVAMYSCAIGVGAPAEITVPRGTRNGGSMRVSYIYFMKDDPDRVAAVAPEHAAHWRGLELREYLGGPFADRSGGLISFETDSPDDAAQLVADDPFVRHGLVEHSWIKEWKVE